MLRRLIVPALALTMAAPAGACVSMPLKIYYAPGSIRLSAADLRGIQTLAVMADRDGFLRLTAHTDTAGPTEANMRLSRRRVAAVRDVLIAAGIAPRRILAESFGESRSITALDDGRADREHRYVLVEVLSPQEARKGRAGKARITCGG